MWFLAAFAGVMVAVVGAVRWCYVRALRELRAHCEHHYRPTPDADVLVCRLCGAALYLDGEGIVGDKRAGPP